MELTTNLAPSSWYADSEVNEIGYWSLDYPPLTAIHEYGMGYDVLWFSSKILVGESQSGSSLAPPPSNFLEDMRR